MVRNDVFEGRGRNVQEFSVRAFVTHYNSRALSNIIQLSNTTKIVLTLLTNKTWDNAAHSSEINQIDQISELIKQISDSHVMGGAAT